jgi:integrase
MIKMPISYMVSNGNGFYLQKRIPKDLLPHYPECRSGIIKRYLDIDLAEAKRKLAVGLAQLEEEWAAKRNGGGSAAELSDKEIERLTALWLHNLLDEDEQARMESSEGLYANLHDQLTELGVPFTCPAPPERGTIGLSDREYAKKAETIEFAKGFYGDALARGKINAVEEDLDDLLKSEGINVSKKSPAYRKLAYSILKASAKAAGISERRHSGEAIDTPPPPAAAPKKLPVTPDGGLPISQAFEKWKAERKPPAKTVSDFGAYVRRFIQVNGDCSVKVIGKREIVAFKDAMLAYPVRPDTKLRTKTVPEVLKALEGDTRTPRLSPRTVNDKALGSIGAVLGWATSNGYCETNASSGVKVARGETGEDKRLPYSIPDMNRIFSFPIFTSGERPKGGGGEAAKWLPLLAAFTGARLEELGQALVEDCKEEGGIAYLDLRVIEEGKRLRRSSSRRMIPIHPQLVACGFLDYAQARREAGDRRLFPDVASKRSEVTAAWSKWWGRYARKYGLTDKRKVFHSFRHAFKDACRAAGIEEAIYDAIQGHSGGGAGRGYGLGYPLSVLAKAMEKVKYDGLDLTGVL